MIPRCIRFATGLAFALTMVACTGLAGDPGNVGQTLFAELVFEHWDRYATAS